MNTTFPADMPTLTLNSTYNEDTMHSATYKVLDLRVGTYCTNSHPWVMATIHRADMAKAMYVEAPGDDFIVVTLSKNSSSVEGYLSIEQATALRDSLNDALA